MSSASADARYTPPNDEPVPPGHERSVELRQLDEGVVDHGIGQPATLAIVTLEGVGHQLSGSRENRLRIAEREDRSDPFPAAGRAAHFAGDGEHGLEHAGLDGIGELEEVGDPQMLDFRIHFRQQDERAPYVVDVAADGAEEEMARRDPLLLQRHGQHVSDLPVSVGGAQRKPQRLHIVLPPQRSVGVFVCRGREDPEPRGPPAKLLYEGALLRRTDDQIGPGRFRHNNEQLGQLLV